MDFENLDLSPRATAALDQLKKATDNGDVELADAIAVAKGFVRIEKDPEAVREAWVRLPGEPPLENVLAERIEGASTVFVIVWEVRPGQRAYVHDLGWQSRSSSS